MDNNKSWNNWLQRASRPIGRFQKAVCPLCNQELQPAELAVFEKHVASDHVQLLPEKAEDKAAWVQSLWKAAQPVGEITSRNVSLEAGPRAARDVPAREGGQLSSARPLQRRQAADPPPGGGSAPATEIHGSPASRSHSPPRRLKVRPTSTPKADDGLGEFKRGPPPKGRLWSTRPPSYDKSNMAANHRLRVSSIPGPRSQRSTHQSQVSSLRTPANAEEDSTELIKQPKTRPISKYIKVDTQNTKNDPSTKLNNDPELRRLRHGIYSFLELLRYRLLASLEYMLSFIYLAYSIIALLYETVPAFEDTWIECLGDLGRYRMAIEDEDIRDREVWTSLYYYTKSLYMAVPFSSAREKKLESSMDEFLSSLDGTIARYHIGISNYAAILGYGSNRNPIFSAIKQIRSSESHDQHMLGGWAEDSTPQELVASLKLANGTHDVVLRRFGDPNILPYLHVILVFVHYLTFAPAAMSYLAPGFPWKLTAHILNTLLDSYQTYSRIEGEAFPQAENAPKRPLPEDYAMRGLLWADKYFPDEWFSSQERIDDDEKYFEVPSMSEDRKERALYLGCRIAAQGGKWLRYNSETHQFSVSP
ncbi:hypothetical protein B0T24DRAFT_650510 [Lasiosphaeria ovina]|uniref:DNA/RNA-binding domain-containing protein n=1 Tax=Lasiosphaeria ovina TaxID=92902 RepID=A0AAE0K917_9PEZI|nr:hypothetical protein B0T24DRAFT_650510 [Lasiosphaeria ovina]